MQEHTNGSAQPLRLYDDSTAAQLPQQTAPPAPGERDHEDTLWYRLLTVIASCSTYVLVHTGAEPCHFSLAPDGTASCHTGTARRWEVQLPEATCKAFPIVIDLWRSGKFTQSEQVLSMALDEPRQSADGTWTVDIVPSLAPAARTRTVARR